MEDAKRAFTCHEAAQAAAISVPMIRKLIRIGKLRAVRIGRCVRIPKGELDRIIDAGTGPAARAYKGGGNQG